MLFMFILLSACEIPDPSLFQKGSGGLYEGGVPAEELDQEVPPIGDTGTIEDTGTTEDTGTEDSGELEDTAIEDTGLVDTGSEDTGTTEDTGSTE